MGFSRQEYLSGLPCPPLADLSDLRIKPTSLTSSALAGGFFTTMPPKRGRSIILKGLQGWKDTLGMTTSEQGQDFNEVKGLLEALRPPQKHSAAHSSSPFATSHMAAGQAFLLILFTPRWSNNQIHCTSDVMDQPLCHVQL